ncbi:hypothetical protein [Caniella muris]|uniref:hypothetical protein n=1 Tax=Caniella muris TaxID=2941502 RepID=UPI00203DB916|nr:hypothetical protein [Caniella muris]
MTDNDRTTEGRALADALERIEEDARAMEGAGYLAALVAEDAGGDGPDAEGMGIVAETLYRQAMDARDTVARIRRGVDAGLNGRGAGLEDATRRMARAVAACRDTAEGAPALTRA